MNRGLKNTYKEPALKGYDLILLDAYFIFSQHFLLNVTGQWVFEEIEKFG